MSERRGHSRRQPDSSQENHTDLYSLLARIDERTLDLGKRLDHLDKRLEEYITRHEFTPVKLIAYGFSGIVFTSVVAALVATVLT